MSIWIYDDNVRDVETISAAVSVTECLYCSTALETTKSKTYDGSRLVTCFLTRCCPVCGWWVKLDREQYPGQLVLGDRGGLMPFEKHYGAAGSLRELNLKDQSIPIEEIRAYLAAKYDARFEIDPWKFEETVASVYRDLGYEARVTARSGDGGIDAILEGPDDSVIGVQVKRYKGKISVEQIRALAGALLINGMTRGIFITTSTFQSGAQLTAERFLRTGMPIELIDAERFYDALGFAQRTRYKSVSDPTAPFCDVTMTLIKDEEEYGMEGRELPRIPFF